MGSPPASWISARCMRAVTVHACRHGIGVPFERVAEVTQRGRVAVLALVDLAAQDDQPGVERGQRQSALDAVQGLLVFLEFEIDPRLQRVAALGQAWLALGQEFEILNEEFEILNEAARLATVGLFSAWVVKATED